MKTITVKADSEFDALLNQLTARLHTTRSRVIRDAVRRYMEYLDREMLKQQIRQASLKTRQQATQSANEFEASNSDGL